jgi:predicted PurR-regulated permease PerM
MADVHPLITIFGVIVGLNLFGFIGIIFGPILFSVFFWLVKLYRYEFIDPNPEDN